MEVLEEVKMSLTGLTPSMDNSPNQEDLETSPQPTGSPIHHNSYCETQRIQCWAVPSSLAVTEGILVSFFSSAY